MIDPTNITPAPCAPLMGALDCARQQAWQALDRYQRERPSGAGDALATALRAMLRVTVTGGGQ